MMGITTHGDGTGVGDRVLRTASELFAAEGLYRVGVDRIIAVAGVAKASFYRHFPSRDDLVLAYVDKLGVDWAAALRQAAGPFATHPADQLLGMFDALIRHDYPDDNPGAAFIRASAETRPGSAAHVRITEHRARILGWITRLARQAGAEDPARLALTLELILIGAQARDMTSSVPETADLARTAARQAIRSAISRKTQFTATTRESA